MENSVEWNKTSLNIERLRKSPDFDEPSKESKYGEYQGRHIIGRDCPINGGVYLGGGEREAVVVDDSKQPELLTAYQELIKRRKNKESLGEGFKSHILEEVYDLSRELLPFNKSVVKEITADLAPDQKISLSSFVRGKGGVCRHQALFAGYLLEKLKNDGLINGKVSVDRNYVQGEGGHAWVRYTNSADQVYIVDPAQDYIGKIEDVGEDQWFYERPSSFFRKIKEFFK